MFIHSGTFIKNDKAIKKEITQIIEKENKLKPYSDEKIRKLLEEKDIYISRRTVTKYREECFIYNSRQRKIEKILWEEKMMQDPRPINTNIKTKLINPEKEKPSRWSFFENIKRT